jgi:hypothetical protein
MRTPGRPTTRDATPETRRSPRPGKALHDSVLGTMSGNSGAAPVPITNLRIASDGLFLSRTGPASYPLRAGVTHASVQRIRPSHLAPSKREVVSGKAVCPVAQRTKGQGLQRARERSPFNARSRACSTGAFGSLARTTRIAQPGYFARAADGCGGGRSCASSAKPWLMARATNNGNLPKLRRLLDGVAPATPATPAAAPVGPTPSWSVCHTQDQRDLARGPYCNRDL